MLAASLFLFIIAVVGACDIAYFHVWRGTLLSRPECRRENLIHIARGVNYGLQLVIVPNLRMQGVWFAALITLFVADVAIAVADVLEEPRSRASQGGLSRGEYLMHMTLSVLVGGELLSVAQGSWGWWAEPSAIVIASEVPLLLRVALGVLALGSLTVAVLEASGLALAPSAPSSVAPIHVRVRLRSTLQRVWDLTQDHRLHPSWDHRFSHITMETGAAFDGPLGTPDPRIRTGTTMRYEKALLGARICGFGRYKLHRPLRQSTFEFWSDDPRSLIARGVGLWRYTSLPDGRVEFATSYTYAVRYGALGRAIDRWVFRPLFQRMTQRSFARLARTYFGDPSPTVLGAVGRRPARFVASEGSSPPRLREA